MYVKQKKTGQTGYLPDNQFDPAQYEQITDQNVVGQLDSAYKETQAQNIVQPQASENQPQYVTGHSLEEHQAALKAARAAGDKTAEADIQADYTMEYNHLKDTGKLGTSVVKKQEAIALKDKMMAEIKIKAQAVKDIVEMGKSGKLKGEQYETALSQAASDFNKQALFAKEDKVAGSALTPIELSQLAGGIIRASGKTQSWVDKITGYVPAAVTNVEDKPDVISQKMDYILTGKTPAGESAGGEEKSVGGFAQNAVTDTGNILNSILGMPRSMWDKAMQMESQSGGGGIYSPEGYNLTNRFKLGVKSIADPQVNPAVAWGQNLNKDIGEPLKGGNIVGRIGENAYNRPVGTLLDILPLLGFLKGPGKYTDVTTQPEVSALERMGIMPKSEVPIGQTPVTGIATQEKGNFAQQAIRKTTDAVTGGGSKEYLKRAEVNPNMKPQNQVLMDKGILLKTTETGRIRATSTAMKETGTKLAETYKAAKEPIMSNEFDATLDVRLKGLGYDQAAIRFMKQYLKDYGELDLATGDVSITPYNVWKAAQMLEKAPPKMLKNPEAAAAYKMLSQDTAAVMRDMLAEQIPEVLPLNADYAALADYMYNVLKDPQGLGQRGGLPAILLQGLETAGGSGLNAMYKILGLGKK